MDWLLFLRAPSPNHLLPLPRSDPEAVELLCRHGTSVPTERHHKTSPLVAALLVEEPAARRAILSTLLQARAQPHGGACHAPCRGPQRGCAGRCCLPAHVAHSLHMRRSLLPRTPSQHDAPVDPYDVLNAIRASQPAELQQLMEARAAAAEGGQPFDAQDAAVLLLKAVSWDRADCLEVCCSSAWGAALGYGCGWLPYKPFPESCSWAAAMRAWTSPGQYCPLPPQVLLAWGLSPQVNIKSGDGRKRTLLKTWFNINWCG